MAAFFIGMDAMRRGDKQRAREQLQLAQARCPTVSELNWAASSELSGFRPNGTSRSSSLTRDERQATQFAATLLHRAMRLAAKGQRLTAAADPSLRLPALARREDETSIE